MHQVKVKASGEFSAVEKLREILEEHYVVTPTSRYIEHETGGGHQYFLIIDVSAELAYQRRRKN